LTGERLSHSASGKTINNARFLSYSYKGKPMRGISLQRNNSESRTAEMGHSLPIHSARVPINVRCYSSSGQTLVRRYCPLSANSDRCTAAILFDHLVAVGRRLGTFATKSANSGSCQLHLLYLFPYQGVDTHLAIRVKWKRGC
jgi:hypothetical protein